MEVINEKIQMQAHIAAAVLLDSIKDADKINGNDLCKNLARNLMINNEDVSSYVGDASRILDVDIFDIIDIYFWAAARTALLNVAREQKIQIKISKFPNC